VLISDPTAGPVGQPLHPSTVGVRCPAALNDGADGGIMQKMDAPRASADTAVGQARRKRHLRNPPRVAMREPQPHGAGTDLQMPAWLPPPVASYARQASCRTETDKSLLRRLTSDPRMRGVWTELRKRKRSNYKRSETFKYPATAGMDWDPTLREMLRRAQTIRRMSDPSKNYKANNIESSVKLQWAAETATWGSQLPPVHERALVAFFHQAFGFARTVFRPVPHAAARKKQKHYRQMADRIWTDVAGLDSLSNKQALRDAAFAYEELADKAAPPPGHPLRVQRQGRGDERQRGFVLQLVDALRAIFGQSLYGTVAIVANVAFECDDWTGPRVRKLTQRTRP
jgi:hypothetical protein